MDRYEDKKYLGLWLPVATEKKIAKGRHKYNRSEEIRRLIELGLEAEAAKGAA